MFPFVMAVLSEPPFSGFEEKSFDEIKALIPSLKEAETLTLLILWKQHDEVMGIAKSCTSEVRARDFLNTVFSGMGLCRGDSVSATGVVTRSNLLVWAEEHGVEELTEYLKKNALMMSLLFIAFYFISLRTLGAFDKKKPETTGEATPDNSDNAGETDDTDQKEP